MASGVSYPLQLSSVSESHAALYEESLKQPERFWGHLASRRLRWIKPFDQVMDCDMSSGHFKWFLGGTLNVSGELLHRAKASVKLSEVRNCCSVASELFGPPRGGERRQTCLYLGERRARNTRDHHIWVGLPCMYVCHKLCTWS